MHTYLSEYIKISSCSENLGHKKRVKVLKWVKGLPNQGFIQALQIMSVFWKTIEFYKGKRDYKATSFAAWGLRHSLGGLSERIASKLFGFFMSLKQLNCLQWH